MTDITERLRRGTPSIIEQRYAADEIDLLRAHVAELQTKCRCVDCHEPPGPVVCEVCATARCESVAAAQRKRDADICRQIHSTSRQRTELALLCAREIEATTDEGHDP